MSYSVTLFLTDRPCPYSNQHVLYDMNEKVELWRIAATRRLPTIADMKPFAVGRDGAALDELLGFVLNKFQPAVVAEMEQRSKLNNYRRDKDSVWTATRRSRTNMKTFTERYLTRMQQASLEYAVKCRVDGTLTFSLSTLLGIYGELLTMVEHFVKLEVRARELVAAGSVLPPDDSDVTYKTYDYRVRYTFNLVNEHYYAPGIENLRACDQEAATELARLVVCVPERKLVRTAKGTASRLDSMIRIDLTLK